jgi:hypothetical protein
MRARSWLKLVDDQDQVYLSLSPESRENDASKSVQHISMLLDVTIDTVANSMAN